MNNLLCLILTIALGSSVYTNYSLYIDIPQEIGEIMKDKHKLKELDDSMQRHAQKCHEYLERLDE